MGIFKSIGKVTKKPWFKTLTSLAPQVAAGLAGGPFAPLALTVLRKVLGNDNLDEQSLEAAITSGDPSIYAAIQQANQQFELEMEKLGIDEQALYLEDVQSARQMQIATMDSTPRNLTYLAMLVFFGVIALIFWQQTWFSTNEFAQNLCFMIIGGALGWVNQGYNFHLGSSRGSFNKSQQQYEVAMRSLTARGEQEKEPKV